MILENLEVDELIRTEDLKDWDFMSNLSSLTNPSKNWFVPVTYSSKDLVEFST